MHSGGIGEPNEGLNGCFTVNLDVDSLFQGLNYTKTKGLPSTNRQTSAKRILL